MSIIEYFRLLLSKENRGTAKEILNFIKRSSVWKNEIVVLKGNFSNCNTEEIQLLINHATQVLAGKKWDGEEIQTVRFISLELVENAFEHGLVARRGNIQVALKISSAFIKIDVTDPGLGFDLTNELQRQGCNDSFEGPGIELVQESGYQNSNESFVRVKLKALGLIYQMGAELSNDVNIRKHTISTVYRKNSNPCNVEKLDNIVIFSFNGYTQTTGYFWAEIVREIEESARTSNIVLDFIRVSDISTKLISKIKYILIKYGWDLKSPKKEENAIDFLEIMSNKNRKKVVVCGISDLNQTLRKFLNDEFTVFEDRGQALKYLKNISR